MRRICVVSDHNTQHPLLQLLQCHLNHSEINHSTLWLLVQFSNILNRHNCWNNLIHTMRIYIYIYTYMKQLNLRLCTTKAQVLYPTQCFPRRNTHRRNNTFHYIIEILPVIWILLLYEPLYILQYMIAFIKKWGLFTC